ncbi:hypothetical protein FVE67_06735 [Thermosulfurimonas marina]|uniref:DUF3782 domain-containing protein n=1 Tax=Thermosulfurimonas marina TaxID=2047767 RepID=A0A6H1WTL3_9BACT|nr:hypothetical protein [Thermosulfurimonas marina]QJA06511.1 hypothetical protein FVE67_06735 [Thermosulfurimonas marina]
MSGSPEIRTFSDLLRVLRTHPEWLEELRSVLLTADLLELPRKFEEFLRHRYPELERRMGAQEFRLSRLERDMEELKRDVKQLKKDVARLKGDNFERKVREKVPSYFGRILLRCRVIAAEEVAELVDEAFEEGRITEEERLEVLRLDVLVKGKLKESRVEACLAAEVSLTVDVEDVERAARRDEVLNRLLDCPVLPVVIGERITEGARRKAEDLQVIVA